jgi:hypothetical protein
VIRKGEPWGHPAGGPPDVDVSGGDGALAERVAAHPGARIRFRPDATSDVARATGLAATREPRTELPMDALRFDPDAGPAVNMLVLGSPPDMLRRWTRTWPATVTVDGRPWYAGPATTVVVATGQFRRGHDVVPRGHPGDGRAEIQVYGVGPSQRRALRARLTTGTHVPHPDIHERTGRRIEIAAGRAVPLEVDGRSRPPVTRLVVEVVADAFRLLV